MLERSTIDRWLAAADGDPTFREVGRYLNSAVRFGDPDGGWVVSFQHGRPGKPRPDSDPTATWDYEFVAPQADWKQIRSGELTFAQALSGILGSSSIRGDRVRAGGDTQALTRLLELLSERPPGERRQEPPGQLSADVVGRYVDVDGIRTYYESVGSPDSGVDILLLHSAGHDGRQWQRFAAELADRAHLVWPDYPGHGKSWPLPGNQVHRSVAALDEFAWSFRSTVGLRRPTVVIGCSLGGNLTLSIAANHGDEVAAVVAFQGADFTPNQTATTLALLNHPHVNPAYYGLDRTKALVGGAATQQAADFIEWGTVGFTSRVVQSDLIAYGDFDLRDRMGEIRCPVLMIRGQDDWLVGAEVVELAAARLAGSADAQLWQPEGIGHYAPAEQPVEMAAAVTTFLTQQHLIA
jgi:pimeloyl-ACP methyl ester carboxylesterase